MKLRTPQIALLAVLPTLTIFVSSMRGAQTVNPAPAPPVQLPPYLVTGSTDLPHDINGTFEKLNHLFDGPFPSLRSGALIEAILWRHRYLEAHPDEQAVIITTNNGERILSATTIYSRSGKVFGSSNALGENQLIAGLTPADLKTPDGMARAKRFIVELRQTYAESALGPIPYGTGAMLDVHDVVKAEAYSAGSNATTGGLLVLAEDTGDYSLLKAQAGKKQIFDKGSDPFAVPGANRARFFGNNLMKQAEVQVFNDPSPELLSWTFQALRDPTRAGIVPVAFVQLKGKFPPANSGRKDFIVDPEAIVFDWEGVQYFYEPGIGTWARPLPTNTITGLPYLCVKNGALMECVYFCSTYTQNHPGTKAVLLASEPSLTAYQTGDKLGLFIPVLGRFTLTKQYLDVLNDRASLMQLRDQLIALQKQQTAAADVIPQHIDGDDPDMQMRRAFLAFRVAGIKCELEEKGPPSLKFTWDGIDYQYGSDQHVHPVSGE